MSLNTRKNFLQYPIIPIICHASVIFVMGDRSVIALTFCLMGAIPWPDTRCPKIFYFVLKNLHFDIFNLILASLNFSKTNSKCFKCSSSV